MMSAPGFQEPRPDWLDWLVGILSRASIKKTARPVSPDLHQISTWVYNCSFASLQMHSKESGKGGGALRGKRREEGGHLGCMQGSPSEGNSGCQMVDNHQPPPPMIQRFPRWMSIHKCQNKYVKRWKVRSWNKCQYWGFPRSTCPFWTAEKILLSTFSKKKNYNRYFFRLHPKSGIHSLRDGWFAHQLSAIFPNKREQGRPMDNSIIRTIAFVSIVTSYSLISMYIHFHDDNALFYNIKDSQHTEHNTHRLELLPQW